MPCYNYCPIAKASARARPKHEDSSPGDCECGSSGDKSFGSSNGGCGGGGEQVKTAAASTRPRLIHKEPRISCPMIGDIENWPPVYDDEDVQVSFFENFNSEKNYSLFRERWVRT
jgi:hypothetical protein